MENECVPDRQTAQQQQLRCQQGLSYSEDRAWHREGASFPDWRTTVIIYHEFENYRRNIVRKERDAKLSEIDHNYQQRQSDLENEKKKVLDQAKEKQAKGEDISPETNRYNNLSSQQDQNFDQYKANRQNVYNEYDSKISAVEKEEEYDYDY